MTVAERQAADVSYLELPYQRPGATSAESLAIPDTWYGKVVDFSFFDPAATTNISYVLFGNVVGVAASIAPADSAVASNVMTALATGGSHIQIAHGQTKRVRIPPKNSAGVGPVSFFSHIEGVATGKLRMSLSTGNG